MRSELREKYGHSASVFVQATGCSYAELSSALSGIAGVASCTAEDAAEKIDGVETVALLAHADGDAEIRPALIRKLVEGGFDLYEAAVSRNSLEDVFHALTADNSAENSAETAGEGAENEQ